MRGVLRHPQLDAAFKELMLTLPGESYIAEQLAVVDPQRVHAVREAMRQQLATELQADWQQAWQEHSDTGAYRPDPVSSGRRACPAWHCPCCAWPRAPRATRSGPARRCSASGRRQHDRPHERPDGTGAKRPPAGRPGPGTFPQAVPARCTGPGQVVRAAGRRLRPWRQRAAGRQAADEAPRLPDQNPNRARSLSSATAAPIPAPSTAPTRRATCSGASASSSWTPSTPRSPPAWRVPWTAGASWPSPTARLHVKPSPAWRLAPNSATTCVKSSPAPSRIDEPPLSRFAPSPAGDDTLGARRLFLGVPGLSSVGFMLQARNH